MPGPDAARGGAHPADDVLALHALGEDGGDDVRRHLAGCARCAGEVAGYRRVVHAARGDERVAEVAPPAGTWQRIAAQVAGEDAPGQDRPVVVRHRPRARRALPVAAALLVGLLAGGVGARALDAAPTPAPVATAALAPVGGGGAGEADVRDVDGHRRLDVRVRDVAAPGSGVLEVWLLDADGGLVAVGPVVDGGLSATLPDDVDLARFTTVDVSREPLDGDPGHSGASVLRGALAGA